MTRLGALSALALLAAIPCQAQVLSFPAAADQVARRITSDDSLFLPTAPFAGGSLAGFTAEGQVEQTAWTVGDGKLTTLQLLAPLRDQLIQAGYKPFFECETRACGGFDFRYEIDVLPEPDMHVNLGDFRYFSARRDHGEADAEYISLVVSRSANTGFVQLTRVGGPEVAASFTASTKTPAPSAPVLAEPAGPIAETLESLGHTTLDDLTFRTGSSELGTAEFASLASLGAYLNANPDRRVILVGHTDTVGALSANIVLSRERARAVMARLIDKYGVAAGQIEADGVGFLAPRASNLTPEGRTRNRRVEVVLTSTQ